MRAPTVEWQVAGACNYDCSYCIQSRRYRRGGIDTDRVDAVLDFFAGLPRITSYNVCYTKLLRDRLALMNAGRIVAEGSPAELVARPLPTPMLEVRLQHCGDCAAALGGWSEVREVIPHAGSLRVRLEPDADPAAVTARIEALAGERGYPLEGVGPAEPDLEDA